MAVLCRLSYSSDSSDLQVWSLATVGFDSHRHRQGQSNSHVARNDAQSQTRCMAGDNLGETGVGGTPRETTEARLHEAEKRFQTLVEHGSAVVYMDEAEEPSDTLYISPQSVDVFGWTPEELMQDQDLWMNAIHPDDRDRVFDLDRDTSYGDFTIEYRIINRRGEIVWLHEQGNLVHDEEGKPLYWLGLAIDITERKRAEGLEKDLTIERATSAKLKALDQAKDDLLTAVSHDFRSPLASILGFGITLERSLPSLAEDEALDFIHRIVENARKLEHLVQDVLDVSRLREGILHIKREKTDLGALIGNFAKGVPPNDKVELQLDLEPVEVWVDPKMIERIIDNLIINAVHHNPAGVQVLVGVRPVDGGAEISVADNGAGVPPELRSSLFDAFTSGEDARHGPSPGLGIGLSIVKQIAELHGGNVRYYEAEDGGAIFKVFLPARNPV
jgi:PAS domain S-box-containing protein